jgi:hypothetical protein
MWIWEFKIFLWSAVLDQSELAKSTEETKQEYKAQLYLFCVPQESNLEPTGEPTNILTVETDWAVLFFAFCFRIYNI